MRDVQQPLPFLHTMNDYVFILISVGFFVLAVGYAYFCEKVR